MKRLIKSAIQYNNLNTLFKRGSINYYNQLAFCSKNQKNEENDKKSFEFAEEENQREKEETKKTGRRVFYILFTAGIVVSGVYFGLLLMKPANKVETIRRSGKVTYVGKAKIGGDWSLENCLTKKEFGNKDLEGKYYLIYFGFTRCPDVCPMSLYKIAETIKGVRKSKESKFFDIEAVFVSVDPDRDTPERVIKYCSIFDPSIIGVTAKANNDPTLIKMLKDFKIHSSKIYLSDEEEEADKKILQQSASMVYDQMLTADEKITNQELKYSLDHTIVTYLIGPENVFMTYLSSNLTSEEMKKIVLEEIVSDIDSKSKKI